MFLLLHLVSRCLLWGEGGGPTTTLSPLPYHKQGVKKFRASENILLPYRLFTAIGDFQIFSQILFAYLAQEAQAKYCVMTFSASPSQGASVQPQWFRVPPHSWLTITSRFFKYRVTKKRQIKNLRR